MAELIKKKWKKLYKLSNTGALIQWEIWTVKNHIYTRHGQVGGQLQKTKDTIKVGKSLKSVKRTTPIEQAQKEARAKFIKQKKRGYVSDPELAKQKKVDTSLIKGGYFPLLAKEFSKAKHHIKYPCALQPKLDGLRMCYSDQALWSRTRKPIIRLPHIKDALEVHFPDQPLDGEGYNHEFKDDFEEIVGKITAKNEVAVGFEKIQYHVYDIPDENKTYEERMELLQDLFRYLPEDSPLKLVPTIIVNNEEELNAAYEQFLEDGYEGAMARNLHGTYEFNKRSNHLQKVKRVEDAEFKIVGINEGRGKLMGHVATFIMEIDDKHGKRTFKAKPKGKGITAKLKEYFEDHSLWKGKWATVEYMGYTKANHKPRHPRILRLRDMDY